MYDGPGGIALQGFSFAKITIMGIRLLVIEDDAEIADYLVAACARRVSP